VEFQGTSYGLRVHQFRQFVNLPGLTGSPFELALAIHPTETKDLALLSDNGWTLVDPRMVAGDVLSYRSYIGRSLAEFSVAKDIYVRTRGGWISDRSLCYLASGKPVLAQETGFSRHFPTGEGLITYSTLEEAVAGVEEITRHPDRHARAARALAEEYFDSDKVLGELLQKLGMA
jgi:Glycosyl transferases group 1